MTSVGDPCRIDDAGDGVFACNECALTVPTAGGRVIINGVCNLARHAFAHEFLGCDYPPYIWVWILAHMREANGEEVDWGSLSV